MARLRLAVEPPVISLETIDFQADGFGNKLEAVFTEINKFILDRPGINSKTLELTEFGSRLSELVYDRFGIKNKFVFDTTQSIACQVIFLNNNHIFADKEWREMDVTNKSGKGLLKINDKKGSINLVKAKVTGIFSTYEHEIHVPIVLIFSRAIFTPAEVTAMVLHEIGHIFTAYEFSDRLEDTNRVLADLANEIRTKNNPARRVYLFKDLANVMDIPEKEFDELLEENDRTVLGSKLFKKYIAVMKSQLPNGLMNQTSKEHTADTFAARFGYGRGLITALYTINKQEPEQNKGVRILEYINVAYANIVAGAMAIVSIMTGVYALVLISSIIYSITLWMSGDSNKDYEYGDLKTRYTRIRHQYVEMINSLSLKTDQLRKVVEDIVFIDSIIKETVVYRSLFDKISNFIFTQNRNAKEDRELQNWLEELTHNELFVAAAKLKLINA